MVTVPRYYDSASLRGRNQQTRSGSASQGGALIGEGIAALAKGITSVAQAVDFRDQLKDEADARNAANQYRDVVRSGLYDPQTGYLNATGANALNGQRGETFESLAAARSNIEGQLSPRAQRAFQGMADGLDNSAKDSAVRHEGVQFRDFTMKSFEASAQGYLDDAILNSHSQEKFTQNVAAAEAELRNAAALAGTPPEQLEQQLSDLRSTANAGRVMEIAKRDPVLAYEYLEKNRDTFSPEHYNKLHDGLEPAYWSARARGVVDSHGGTQSGSRNPNTPTGDWLQYDNEGKIRDKPLSRELVTAMEVLPAMGLGFEVVSGGQDEHGHGERRTGSTRHDNGNSADGYFTKDGRRLNWANPEDQAIIVDAIGKLREAGVTGIGAGPGYMGEGSVHIGFGKEAVWGAGGKSENAPDWLVAAFNGTTPAPGTAIPRSGNGMTLTEAMQIDNPKLREATIREIEMRRRAYANDRDEKRRAALEDAWSVLDNGGSPEQIPPNLQAEIGLQAMNDIFNQYERNQTGVDYTDEARHLELLDMATQQPKAFASLDLNEDRTTLSRGDLLAMKELQAEIKATEQQRATGGSSSIVYTDSDYRQAMSDASEQYQAAVGVAPGTQMSQEQMAQYNRFTQQLRTGMRAFANENHRQMTFEERTNFINTLLAPVAFSDSGTNLRRFLWGPFSDGTKKGYLFEGASQGPGTRMELQYEATDIPAGDAMRIQESLTEFYGRAPSADEVVEQYENEVLLSVGISPTIEYGEIPQDIRRQIFRQYPDASEAEVVEIFRGLMLQSAATSLQGDP